MVTEAVVVSLFAGRLNMLSIVCWKWKPKTGYRSAFGPETVNTLRAMVRRYYQKPHRFICVTDDAAGIAGDVEIIPLWDDYAAVPSPHGAHQPSCYRRLKAFSLQAAALFGPRFVSLDLDCVVTGDLSPVWDRDEDFVIWGDTSPKTPYNGSMFMMRAGSRRQVWEDFDPQTSPAKGRALGYFGSDQAWIGARLGPHEKKWSQADGVYSYRNDIKALGGLPDNARIVMFHGKVDPWDAEAQRLAWVRAHYRGN
ncbi:hypothetical protein [Bradyrhizobium sp. JYMT SZCCT0428]|uniref:hypothetical protein n=1 Tax=Bradyrhizobium sp. JYMT SZCCT0428 TaxID=2807673 RepID=UPI001BA72757|nr:hypothetical protein [Bradyrhizobium sp. JYMT SZCCT0428]MBR1150087.1 hypothetical protein [Bradyrhizobium sp. JYMT SZCCT0428]